MEYATGKQIALIDRLAARKYASTIEAIDAYGLGLRAARDLTKHDASEVIDWLLGNPIAGTRDPAAAAKAEADAAEFERRMKSRDWSGWGQPR